MDLKENSILVKRIATYTHHSIFDRLRASEILVGDRNFFLPLLAFNAPYGVAPGSIAVIVTRLERGFNACKVVKRLAVYRVYPSIFNRFPVIQA